MSRYKLTEIFNHYLNYYLSTISRSLVKKQGTPLKVHHRYFNTYKCFNTKCIKTRIRLYSKVYSKPHLLPAAAQSCSPKCSHNAPSPPLVFYFAAVELISVFSTRRLQNTSMWHHMTSSVPLVCVSMAEDTSQWTSPDHWTVKSMGAPVGTAPKGHEHSWLYWIFWQCVEINITFT